MATCSPGCVSSADTFSFVTGPAGIVPLLNEIAGTKATRTPTDAAIASAARSPKEVSARCAFAEVSSPLVVPCAYAHAATSSSASPIIMLRNPKAFITRHSSAPRPAAGRAG